MRVFSLATLLAVLSGCASTPPVVAQSPISPADFQRAPAPFPVEVDGADVPLPFTGGFWAPVGQLVDLTGDGRADLAVASGGAGIGVYENTGDGWAWQTGVLGGITPGPWFRFVDVDADGDPDLFTRGLPGQTRYFENTGTASVPSFTLRADPLLTTDGGIVQIEDTSVPAWGDADGDGDPDIIAGKADLGTITYYRLDGFDGDLPQYARVTETWEGIQIYEGQPQCVETIGANGLPGPLGRATRHGANAIAFADIEAGGGPELLWGDFFTERLFYFLNTGTPEDPELTLQTESFPEGDGTPGAQNQPSFGDADGDGDLDLLVAVLGGLCVSPLTSTNNLVYFENTGTATTPGFARRTTRLIESVDEGRRSVPALADLDGDGDLDLVVGDGNTDANLTFYRNTGSASAPRFVLEDDDWLGLEYDFGGYAPVFGDLDGDGDLDLLVGGFNGRLAFLENTGSATTGEWTLQETRFANIDAGQYAKPVLGDLDGDGDLDLAIGESNGRVFVYRNVGDANAPAFETQANGQPVQADLDFRDAIGLPDDVGQESSPALVDLDGDGDLDALIGTANGEIQVHLNAGTAQAPQFALAGEIDAERVTTTPRAADLTGDGVPDILAGADSGGLLYWSGTFDVSVAPFPSPAGDIAAFPNPSTGSVRLEFGREVRGDVIVRDARGREVRRLAVASDTTTWDGRDATGDTVPAGVYLVHLGDSTEAGALVTLAR